jgi:acyl dehydratase
MIKRHLPAGDHFFEDLAIGDGLETEGLVVTESHVVQFAGLSGDFFSLHMDDDFAKAQGFPARVAHGLLVLALADGLKNRASARIMAVASLGWRVDFRQPVFAGDRISAAVEITGRRLSSKGKPLLTLSLTVTNQNGAVVQAGETTLVVRRRAEGAREETADA